jgi:hypothetical protein
VSLKQKPVMICFGSSVFSKEILPRVSGHHRRHLVLVMLLDLDVLLLVSLHRSIRHRDQTQDKCSFTSLVLMVMTATTPFSKLARRHQNRDIPVLDNQIKLFRTYHLEKFALSWGRDKSKRTSGRAATTAPKITEIYSYCFTFRRKRPHVGNDSFMKGDLHYNPTVLNILSHSSLSK